MKHIPLGYGTYGLKNEDPFEAMPRLKAIGYELIELTAAQGWPTAPDQLDASARQRLASLLQSLDFPPPVLLAMPQPFSPERPAAMLDKEWRDLCTLARDLHFGSDTPALVTVTLGNHLPDWSTGRDAIAEKVSALGRVAAEHGVVLAIEPHVGCSFDRPEKAVWLVRQVDSLSVRLNCDISHFLVQSLDIDDALRQMIPFTVYAHVKDAEGTPDAPRFLLPGKGEYDFSRYYETLQRLSYDGPVVVEVSGHVWTKEDYRPWEAAAFCFDTLDAARRMKNRLT